MLIRTQGNRMLPYTAAIIFLEGNRYNSSIPILGLYPKEIVMDIFLKIVSFITRILLMFRNSKLIK